LQRKPTQTTLKKRTTMTPISQLGEFGLIRHLTTGLKNRQPSTLYAVGDDAAVLNHDGKQSGSPQASRSGVTCTLVTTDLLLEGIHFNLEYVPLRHLGYKAVAVNVSDICAMNARPTQITVALGVSSRFSVEDLEDFYAGVRAACEHYQVDLVGGDTCASMNGLTIAITCLGTADEKDIVYRNGAKPNDLICVTGNLGSAYLGLQLLERELQVFRQTQHDNLRQAAEGNDAIHEKFEGREYLLERQLRPEARVDIVQALAKAGIRPTAMMDVSDGLSSELFHICTQSKVGCDIYEDKLPIDYQAAALAEEMNLNIVTCALNGGEDYELLFTCDIHDYEKLVPLDDVYIIGHITPAEYEAGKTERPINLRLIPRNGNPMPLTAQGWNAFPQE